MRRPFLVLTFSLTSVVMAACAGSDQVASSSRTSGIEALTADTAAGKTAFEANCTRCHGSNGKSGSAHENVPASASSDTATAINTIIAGKAEMPSFSSLSDQTIADIIGYAKTLN